LSGHHRKRIVWLLEHVETLRAARELSWSEVQPLLVADGAGELVDLAEALSRAHRQPTEAIEACRQKLTWPKQRLDPPPLITGDDLIRIGLSPSPRLAIVLDAVRAAQLENRLNTKQEGLALARRIWGEEGASGAEGAS
jgi:hypothetical protein